MSIQMIKFKSLLILKLLISKSVYNYARDDVTSIDKDNC